LQLVIQQARLSPINYDIEILELLPFMREKFSSPFTISAARNVCFDLSRISFRPSDSGALQKHLRIARNARNRCITVCDAGG
jgi:hypothetical protein